MTGRRWLSSLILLAGVGLIASRLPVFAGDDKDIQWKAFDKGSVFYQVLTTKTTQTMKVQQMDVKQEQNQVFYIKWTAGDKVDGNWVVTQQIIGVKMTIDIGGNKIEYDSTDEKAPKNPMSEFFDALTKAELKFHIDPKEFKLKKIEGREEFIKKLSSTNPQIDALLKSILSESALMQMAEPTWAAFPTEADRKDWTKDKKTWERKSTLNLGPIGVYTFKNNYTWGDKDKVKIDSTLEYKEQTDPKLKEGLPFTIKSGNLSGDTKLGESYATFDRAKGRFKESKIDMKLKGNLKIDIGGMETSVDLDQTQMSSVETRDDNPLEQKKKEK